MLGKIQSLKEMKGEMNFIINNSPLKVIYHYDQGIGLESALPGMYSFETVRDGGAGISDD